MLSRIYYYGSLLSVLVYSLPLLAFGVTAHLRFRSVWFLGVHDIVPQYYVILLVFTQFVWLLIARHYKLSSVANLLVERTGIRTAFLACFVTLLLQTALLVFVKQMAVSRIFILLSNVVLFVCVVTVRCFFRVTSDSSAWPRKSEKLLVVGTDLYSQRSLNALRDLPFYRYDIQAYVQLPGQTVLVDDAPVLQIADLPSLEELTFDEIVVATPSEDYLRLSPVLTFLQRFGKPIRALLDLGPRLSLSERVLQVGQLQLMNLAISPTESFAYTVLKRTFDLGAAVLGVIVLSPLFFLLTILIKLESRGPVLFRQERVGRNGTSFLLLKFRTMQCGGSAKSDTTWTVKNDPRCTRIGAMLRRFSLDELPQLFNVIRGDMSLVGPRPERPYFVAKFRTGIENYNLRHNCQVGITGWAQVHGLRGDTSIPDRLQYDLNYISNWSFILDLRIIARTMFTALKGDNAY